VSIGIVSLQIVVLVVMVIGLLGLLTTIIPGLTIIWVAALVYFLVTGFNTGSIILFVVLTLLMLGGNLLDNLFMAGGARKTGASWLAVGVALVAGVVGTIAFPPFGGLVAALLGVFLVEYLRLRDVQKALESARGLAAGCGWAVLTRFGVGLVMILAWLLYILLARS
jgi:hypothetical protein